ncbi:MAG: TIGR04283 family arsenosugar biosynthesis glycosyltransferase [Ginsengibacter sp.]
MISIIIPTYNEEKNIGKLVAHLKKAGGEKVLEIIVSDGGSNDLTLINAKQAGASAYASPLNGRAAQMNFGASLSKGSILYFVHADTLPPETFAGDIIKAIEAGFDFGRFRTKFDSSSVLLKMNAWLTRFDLFECYGGDQTLFIKSNLFRKVNGFNENQIIMEDYDIVERTKKLGKYAIIKRNVIVSARKYQMLSWYKVQKANYKMVKMYKKGVSPMLMLSTYKKLLTP